LSPEGIAERERGLADIGRQVRECLLCRLWESRLIAVPGEGDPDSPLMMIGEAPGEVEDRTGRPFMGMAGRYLDACLGEAGLPRRRIFITSSVKCRPPGNRTPRADELITCSRYWRGQLALISPACVMLLGRVATAAVLGEDLAAVQGRLIERDGTTFLPTFHPAAARRFPRVRGVAFKSDLARAVRLIFC
jgi:DNA polymerase